ncbi:DUF2934 domain-containing protein [Pseudomonas veronii]|uniref:DUF2934 domain-containing protein n=1 Tax=Pseudomonas veronii TaxID=76761 RepID=A0A4P7Y972_PSEVE|nr:DUF2934 domain-containing protein [Pseudomonas veronii]QCG67289.1 DUF2934 domain-containing protein [Pseudomonas veronii]
MSTEDKRVREFAYQIWESEGKPQGQDARHWEMARKLAEAEALTPSKPKPAAKPKTAPKPAAKPSRRQRPQANRPRRRLKSRRPQKSPSRKPCAVMNLRPATPAGGQPLCPIIS